MGVDLEVTGPGSVDQRRQHGGARLWFDSGGPARVAEQPDESAHLGDRFLPGGADGAQRDAGPHRVVNQLLGGAGLHDHHGHRVRDDVMEFPGDPGAFVGHGGGRAGGAGTFHGVGAVLGGCRAGAEQVLHPPHRVGRGQDHAVHDHGHRSAWFRNPLVQEGTDRGGEGHHRESPPAGLVPADREHGEEDGHQQPPPWGQGRLGGVHRRPAEHDQHAGRHRPAPPHGQQPADQQHQHRAADR